MLYFTPRELEVLQLIAKATLRKNIAAELHISIHTVDAHLRSIHRKTDTASMAELLLYLAHTPPEVCIEEQLRMVG